VATGRLPGLRLPAGRRLRLPCPARAVVAAALWAIVTFVTMAAPTLARAQSPQPVPPLQARVTDLAGTLDAAQRARLDAGLAALEARTGAQVAILIVPTTQPEAIEPYAIRVAEAWKLGRGRERAQRDTGDARATAIDDGVLVLVAKNDRKVRIEVGYGLEGAIPDAIAKRIITESISPRFRAGDFAGGLEAGVADLSRRIAGEALPAPWQPSQGAEPEVSVLPAVLMAFIVGLFVSRAVGRVIGALLGGGGAGVAATVGLASTGLGALVGVGVGLMVLAMGGRGGSGGGPLQRLGRRTIGHGPVVLPGSGWGGGFGGGGGGGGFGGGGGGFGGGGASGDW
jgi:uncharacterized protein